MNPEIKKTWVEAGEKEMPISVWVVLACSPYGDCFVRSVHWSKEDVDSKYFEDPW